MMNSVTRISPESKCQRCGTVVMAARESCPVCLERDVSREAARLFDPVPEFSGRLAGSDFTMMEEIGRGGMGVVFRARQGSPARDVAIKVLQPHLLSSPEIRRRLLAEAAAMAELNHPGILPLYASGETDGQPWLAMKLASRGSLSARRKEWIGQWRPSAELLAELTDAVQHAHERGLVHRDVKPGNVLFDETGRACLADFGLVKWLDAEASDTLSLAMLGTPAYLAPEVAIAGGRAATTASDVYGLGAILYEFLTGAPPFKGAATAELLRRIATEEPPAPRRVRPDVPADLEVICLKAISKEPAARYGSAAAFGADLRRWLAGEVIMARRFSVSERMVRWARRHPLPASLAAALAVAVTAGGITVWLQNRELKNRNIELRAARDAAEDRVTYMTRELPPILAPLGRLHVLNDVFENVQKYYEGPLASTDAAGLARQADFHTQWAQVLRPQGRGADARNQLDKAVSLATTATSRADAGIDAWLAHTVALRRRGEQAVMEDDHVAAQRLTEAAIEVADTGLRLFPGNLPLRVEKAHAFAEQAYATMERDDPGDPKLAMTILDATLSQWRALVAEASTGSPDLHLRSRRQEASCLFEMGRASLELDDLATALNSFKQCHAARAQLAADFPDSAEERRFLCSACNRMGDALIRRKDPPLDEVAPFFEEAERISASLVKLDPANLRWQAEWGLSALAMGNLESKRGNSVASRKWLEDTASRLEPVKPSAFPTVMASRALALHYLAWNHAGAGEAAAATKHWMRALVESAAATMHWTSALEVAFENLIADPFSWAGHSQWTDILYAAARHRAKHETPGAFEEDLQRWLKRVEAEVEKPGASPWWQRNAASLHRRLANLYAGQNRAEEATAENGIAFRLRSDLLKTEPRAERKLVDETTSAAAELLKTMPSDDDRKDVAKGLTRCAARAAVLQPDGVWRRVWANLVYLAVQPLSPAERVPFITDARRAIFPEPPPRPWTADEQKGLTQLRKLETPVAASITPLPPPPSP